MASRWQRIYLVGDSLTQQSFSPGGWGARLADAYQRKFDIINRGFSGYTSTYVSMIITCSRMLEEDQVAERKDVAVAVVMLGANDAVLQGVDARHVPVDTYVSNMRAISAALVVAGVSADRQIFVGPPPVVEEKWRAWLAAKPVLSEMNLSNDHTRLYSEALSTLAKELGLGGFVELHSSFQQEENWPALLSDGLHFSPEGNAVLGKKLIAMLDTILPSVDPAYPLWDAVDPKNPSILNV